ncbi:hypothetical protein LSTR_LSTR010016 [Laodelphax striatellus]|uniref:palmitoyl-CoA hydrolase n=1 Tax=Laodelphax striatellus TaxID=195883 RepID=A0A482WQ03_LAOST|nr:hypothetical protein LSTR_LSTR010016 [Laodelphax striatellus]
MYLGICFITVILFYVQVIAYKPVIIIHGVMTGNSTMVDLENDIVKGHPGTKVYVTNRFGSYSQGGLIARGIIEAYPNLNVKKFISLSSPQGGQYGTKFLHLLFPSLSVQTAYELFYSVMGQEISVANYWRDPHQPLLYMDYSCYLPYINNEIESEGSSLYKNNIEKLEKLIMFGGPDDGVITPWQSSRFAYFDKDENVIELYDQPLYQFNSLGLRKLNETGRLKVVELAGVSHFQWHTNKTVIYDHLLPELD